MRIGVLSDDFTGAGDAALAFERAGFRTEIGQWPPGRPPGRGKVWVLSTESRGLSAAAARGRARAAAGAFRRWNVGFIFKKIDSTLRGPVGPELDGLGDALGGGFLPFVPAFPAMGRTTVAGRHFVDGVPLHKTAFGRDPRNPLRTDRVADILGPRRTARLWIPDVLDDAALRRAARETLRRGARAAAGSAGFAAALADLMPGRGKKLGSLKGSRAPSPKSRPPVLVVVGSAHPRSRRQARAVEGAEGAVVVSAPARRGRPDAVLRSLIRRALREEKRRGLRRFAVAGGETAAALARAWGGSRWRVLAEIERGAPLCESLGRPRRWLALKPGGFGGEGVLVRAVERLQGVR